MALLNFYIRQNTVIKSLQKRWDLLVILWIVIRRLVARSWVECRAQTKKNPDPSSRWVFVFFRLSGGLVKLETRWKRYDVVCNKKWEENNEWSGGYTIVTKAEKVQLEAGLFQFVFLHFPLVNQFTYIFYRFSLFIELGWWEYQTRGTWVHGKKILVVLDVSKMK